MPTIVIRSPPATTNTRLMFGLTVDWDSGRRVMLRPAFGVGYSFARRAAIARISSSAWLIVTPGFRRATALSSSARRSS